MKKPLPLTLIGLFFALASTVSAQSSAPPRLLTEPFLQQPTTEGVHVVWFTTQKGEGHQVIAGSQTVSADSFRFTKAAEDPSSRVGEQTDQNQVYKTVTPREVWRHEAILAVKPGEKVNYKVVSIVGGQKLESKTYQAAGLPQPGQPLKIMLTSGNCSAGGLAFQQGLE